MSAAVSDYYVVIPLPLLDAPGSALKVYAVLRSYLNPAEPERSEVWPTRKTLAERSGISINTLDRAVDWLEENGWIVVEQRRDPQGDLTSCRYIIYGSQRSGGTPKIGGTVPPKLVEEVEPPEVKTKARATTRTMEFSSITADPPPQAKRKAAHPIPEDYQPDPDLVKWTKENAHGIDAKVEWANFYDHALANDRRQVDWRRAWMTWARKAVQYNQNRRSPQRRARTVEDSLLAWTPPTTPIDYQAEYDKLVAADQPLEGEA